MHALGNNQNQMLTQTDINIYIKKKKNLQINSGEDIQKREPSYTVSGNVNWCSHCGKQYAGFLKTKNKTTI